MSSLGRYVVDAVVLEHRSPTQLFRSAGFSSSSGDLKKVGTRP